VSGQAGTSESACLENPFMTFVITEGCTKDASCVAVCPVDCISTTDESDQYFINPDECIDCGACEPECPARFLPWTMCRPTGPSTSRSTRTSTGTTRARPSLGARAPRRRPLRGHTGGKLSRWRQYLGYRRHAASKEVRRRGEVQRRTSPLRHVRSTPVRHEPAGAQGKIAAPRAAAGT
jgi:NAD-dependent dihydropyrimidine dehydrogenase PreA subunit